MPIRLYNTYSKSVEEFEPLESNRIKMYVCGPTVYDYIHIGNARPFVVFDVLRRFFKYRGYEVTYVMNLTDIDDRIIERANEQGVDMQTTTEKYSRAFFEHIEALGVAPADIYPRATDHVDDIIQLIQKLVDSGIAYAVEGDVYYDVSKFENYGRLSGKRTEELMAGARISVDERKRNPLDFVLWKSQKPGEPVWDSPWGPGRPGWHIECSSMSMKYLGPSFDIHAGGVDLVFPHHENEIAQSEAATGQKFVRYWLHNGFLQIEGEKMAKSLGNFRTVRDVLEIYPGEVIRMFFLQKHYRSPIDFSSQGLETARSAAQRLRLFWEKLQTVAPESKSAGDGLDVDKLGASERAFWQTFSQLREELVAALEDDFNTPAAVGKVFEMVRETNKRLTRETISGNEAKLLSLVRHEFEALNGVFGLLGVSAPRTDTQTVPLIELLVDVRKELRARKAYDLADRIRDLLSEIGVVLEDKGEGTTWRRG